MRLFCLGLNVLKAGICSDAGYLLCNINIYTFQVKKYLILILFYTSMANILYWWWNLASSSSYYVTAIKTIWTKNSLPKCYVHPTAFEIWIQIFTPFFSANVVATTLPSLSKSRDISCRKKCRQTLGIRVTFPVTQLSHGTHRYMEALWTWKNGNTETNPMSGDRAVYERVYHTLKIIPNEYILIYFYHHFSNISLSVKKRRWC